MKIPSYSRCPFCNGLLSISPSHSPINKCYKYFNFSYGYSWIRCKFDNFIICIYDNNSWTIKSTSSGYNNYKITFPKLIAEGNNADELFNISDLNSVKETAQTIILYS